MQINSSSAAATAVQALHVANASALKATERISTQLRINRAADDPAGLGIANRFKAQIASMSKAIDNLNQGIGLAETAGNSLSQVTEALINMREAVVGTTDATKTDYTTEIQPFKQDILDLIDGAKWNSKELLKSTTALKIQAGPGSDDVIDFSLGSTKITKANAINSTTSYQATLDSIDEAMEEIDGMQAYVGAKSRIFASRIDGLDRQTLISSEAYGQIMNADMAQETLNLAKSQMQAQASTAMLTQALQMDKDMVSYLLKDAH